MKITVEKAGYKAIFSFGSTTYEHFCKGLQFHDHSFTFFSYNKSFDTYQELCESNTPDWLIQLTYKRAAARMIEELHDSDKELFVGQTHSGEDSGWGYIEHQWKLLPFFEMASSNSMILYEDDYNGIVLEEYVFSYASLREVADMAVEGIPEEEEEDDTLTEEKIRNYIVANF